MRLSSTRAHARLRLKHARVGARRCRSPGTCMGAAANDAPACQHGHLPLCCATAPLGGHA